MNLLASNGGSPAGPRYCAGGHGGIGRGGTAAPARAPSPGMHSVTGTVKTVDLSGGTLDLVTGVGYALRIQRVRLPAPLKVQGAARESTAVVLAPGSIVRVEFRTTTEETTASKVELVRPAPRRVKP